jgi:microcystin-dependent protein/cytoskeletal protein CcmA (bactofilin family)
MPYNITNTSNTSTITVQDNDLNTETNLSFVGKNYQGYSQALGENFLHLLENFASSTAPDKAIAGQLWYNTATNILLVNDGTGANGWKPTSNIIKGTGAPRAEKSLAGDLWIDTVNQQLYLFTGAIWLLVGPQFSLGSLSGIKAEELIDRDTNTGKYVLTLYVNDSVIAIVSKFAFTPKTAILGFETIKQGINLSTEDFDLDGIMLNKLWGTAEKADSLIVGTSTVPAANFLRGDVVSTTNYVINIRNGGGIVIGDSLETSLTTSSAGAILDHKNQNSPIILRTTTISGESKDVITVTGTERVGINNTNPDATLDVAGTVNATGNLTIESVTDSTSTITGSIVTAGGIGIAGKLNVGNNATVVGLLETDELSVSGDAEVTGDLTADTITADTFTGNVVGNVTGSVTGSAARLVSTAQFSIRGDIESNNTIPFNGSNPVPLQNISTVARSASNIATVVTASNHGYVSGYIVTVDCSNTTFNTSNAIITVTGLDRFTYTNIGALVSTVSATGEVTVNPGGTFITSLNDNIIVDKQEFTNSNNTDYFLVYRDSGLNEGETIPGPKLRKISKSTLFSTAGTVPAGSIMPYAGDVLPPGYLFCDGSEQSQSIYPELFSVLGYKYRAFALLSGFQTFALPDLRGRFALGKETMENSNTVSVEIVTSGASRAAITTLNEIQTTFVVTNSLTLRGPFQPGRTLLGTDLVTTNGPVVITNVATNTPSAGFSTLTVSMPPQPTIYPAVTGTLSLSSIGVIDAGGGSPSPSRVAAATELGYVGGLAQRTITANQMPTHGHLFDDIRWSEVSGAYTYNDPQLGPISVGPGAGSNRGTDYDNGAHFLQHGTYNAGGSQPIDMMNPYQTINYIIFTGRII